MADDLNSLLQANRSSSVLQGIMNPAQVNPLAAMTSAAQTAGTIFDARAKQGQGLWGQALQQATDANGNVDYAKANAIAATMGPAAAQAAAVNLSNNSNLTGAQLEQAVARNNFVGTLAAQGMNDTSDASWASIRAKAVAANLPPSALAEIDRISALPEAQRRTEAFNHVVQKMDPQGILARSPYAPIVTTPMPQGQIAIQTTQSSPYNQGGVRQAGGVGSTLSPGEQAQYQQWLQGEVDIPDPNNPGGTQKATRLQMFQKMNVDPKLFYPGGGGGSSDTSPLATVPTAATLPASQNAASPPQTTTSPNAGKSLVAPSQADIETQKAGAQMGIGLTQRAGLVPENRTNLGNMLTDANALDTMGAGSQREAYLNSFFQKWTGRGLLGNATQEQIAGAEKFAKIANIMAASQMASLGASDSRQQLAIGANPHLDLSKMGNEQIIHMLQGNEDAIAAKSSAWENWKLSHGSGSYAQFQNDLNKDFDLRVFQQRYMSQPEIDAMKAQMKSQGTDKEFIRKVLVARQRGWIQ